MLLIRGAFLSVLDQAVCSLSNFLTGVIVARTLMPEAFGIYSLYFTAIVVLGGLQYALVTGPVRVLGVRPAGVDAGGYLKAQIILQLILSAALIATAGFALLIIYPSDTGMTFSFLLCLLLFQLQELARVINLTRITLESLLVLDLVTHGFRLGLLLTAVALDILTPGFALLVIAVSCGIGVATVARNIYAKGTARAPLAQAGGANWRYGRWLLLETMAYTSSTQVYMYVTALSLDAASVGGLSAVLVLMNGLNALVLGVMNIAIPVARRNLMEHGYTAWRRCLQQLGLPLAGGAAIFGIIATVFARSLLSLIYSPTYSEFAFLVPLVAAQLILSTCNTVLSASFGTAELPQVGFAAKAASAIVTLGLAYPLLRAWGLAGAAVGLVLTQALWTCVYAACIARGMLGRERVTEKLESYMAAVDPTR